MPFLESLALKPTHGSHILLVNASLEAFQMQGGREADSPSEGVGSYYKGTYTLGGEEFVDMRQFIRLIERSHLQG